MLSECRLLADEARILAVDWIGTARHDRTLQLT